MRERLITSILFLQVLTEDHTRPLRDRRLVWVQVVILVALAISITVLIGRAVDALPQR